jgi:hypothetical protein
MPACLQCTAEFPAPPARRGKVQVYCSRPCQTKAANARRASTRAGRIIRPTDNGITYPHAGEPLQRLKAPEAMTIPRAWIGQPVTARTPPAIAYPSLWTRLTAVEASMLGR